MITKILKKGKNSTISSLFAGIVVIMAMFMTVACEKDETSVADQQQTVRKPQPISDMEVMQYLPEVVDGRLVFKDSVSFMNYLQWIFENQGNDEKIKDLNYSMGFISMQEIYSKGIESLESCDDITNEYIRSYPNVFYQNEVDGSIIQDLQAPPVLSYVINSDGIYQIDKWIVKVSYNYYYKLNSEKSYLLSELIKMNGGDCNNENILVFSTKRTSEKYGQYSYNNAYFPPDSIRRVTARLSTGFIDGVTWYFAEANSQRKIAGVWLGRQLDGVWVSWPAGYWYVTGQNTQIAISARTDGGADKQTQKSCFLMTSADVDKSRSYVRTTHYGDYNSMRVSHVNSNAFIGADD